MINSLRMIAKKFTDKFILKSPEKNEIAIQAPVTEDDKEKKCNIVFNLLENDEKLIQIDHLQEVKLIVKNTLLHLPLELIYREVATFLTNIGQPEIARFYFKKSLEISHTADTYSLYLQSLLLDASCSDEQMHAEASRYNQFFEGIKRYDAYDNVLNPEKRLNIGYICHFFYNSVSQSLLLPFLRAHHRDQVKVFCYSDTKPNEVGRNIKSVADVWRDTKNLDDAALAEQIRKDKIDVLLELNGHIIVNRYGVIARKPAPIQISYYNQAATTGLSTIDYLLIGNSVTIDKTKEYYTESIYTLNGPPGIAKFSDKFPLPAAMPPCLEKGYITFGSFGAAHKVTTTVVRLWAQILKQLPDSMLYMKAGVLSLEAFLNAYKKYFAAQGIDLARIRFEGFSEHLKMLECYADVDIALDTFPHAAGTTTMEATWQGVPVITLYGEKYRSQNGKVVHTTINHPELVTYSEEEYIAKAISLANDKAKLIEYRKCLRDDFRNSPLASAEGHATRLENAYRDMWRKYCSSQA